MKYLKYRNGWIICPKQSFPKRKNCRNIYIENFAIDIYSEEDLLRGYRLGGNRAAPVQAFKKS